MTSKLTVAALKRAVVRYLSEVPIPFGTAPVENGKLNDTQRLCVRDNTEPDEVPLS
jgi:hypothetical protein